MDFETQLCERGEAVLLDLWAPWCAPCRALEPMLKRAGKEWDGRVAVWRLNLDQSHSLASSLRVHAIPTLIAFHNGREVARHTGIPSPERFCWLLAAAEQGETLPKPEGLSLLDRGLRMGAGLTLVAVGLIVHSLLLGLVGGIILFLGVRDRCPLWRAIRPRLSLWAARLAAALGLRPGGARS